MKIIKKTAFIIAVLSFSILPLQAKPVALGFSLQTQAGISPLLVINENSVGFRATYGSRVLIDSTTAVGHSFNYIDYTGQHWFHISQNFNVLFDIHLAESHQFTHSLALGPSGYISYSPKSYFLYGGGAMIKYRIHSKENNSIIEPFSLYFRPLIRVTTLSYPWNWQAGIMCSRLWEI